MSPVILKQVQDHGCFLMILFFKQICPARLHLLDDYVLPTKKGPASLQALLRFR